MHHVAARMGAWQAPRAMIQPVAKLHFVERYCKPSDGWRVFVDIDASEEGKTGSARQTAESQARQSLARTEALRAIADLIAPGAHVRERKPAWLSCFGKGLPLPKGDRDILAVDCDRRRLWIVEVEGDSSGQPEGKILRRDPAPPDETARYSLKRAVKLSANGNACSLIYEDRNPLWTKSTV